MATSTNTNPRTLKKPQDHKQPKDETQTVTINGVEIKVDGSRMDDLGFMEALYDISNDPERNAMEIIPFLRGLFGDQYDEFKRAVRDKDTGLTPMSGLGDILTDVFRQLDPNS